MRILAIDYGTKRIGLAVSDPLGFTAQGIETLPNTGIKNVLESLKKTCRDYSVKEVVIGLPINMNGSHGPGAQEILKLAPELEDHLGVPVKTWDERLSSKQVGRLMIEQGLSRKRQKESSDRLAATVILQNYLESQRK